MEIHTNLSGLLSQIRETLYPKKNLPKWVNIDLFYEYLDKEIMIKLVDFIDNYSQDKEEYDDNGNLHITLEDINSTLTMLVSDQIDIGASGALDGKYDVSIYFTITPSVIKDIKLKTN